MKIKNIIRSMIKLKEKASPLSKFSEQERKEMLRLLREREKELWIERELGRLESKYKRNQKPVSDFLSRLKEYRERNLKLHEKNLKLREQRMKEWLSKIETWKKIEEKNKLSPKISSSIKLNKYKSKIKLK